MTLRLFTSTTFGQCSWACLPKQKAQLSVSCLVRKSRFLSFCSPCSGMHRVSGPEIQHSQSPRGHGLLSAPDCSKRRSAIPPWTSLWNPCPAWSSVERPQAICAVGRYNHCRVCVSISLRAFSPRKCVSQLSHNCLNRRVSLSLKTCGKLSRSFTCALWMAVSFPYRFFKTSTASA